MRTVQMKMFLIVTLMMMKLYVIVLIELFYHSWFKEQIPFAILIRTPCRDALCFIHLHGKFPNKQATPICRNF